MILKRILICSLCCLFFSCKKDPALWEIENLNGNKITVLGHGGMGIKSLYPINSLESLQRSIQKGADGVEIDVCVTRDSVLVLKHSQVLTNKTNCNGLIKEQTWAEIENCKYNLPLFSRADLIRASFFFDKLTNRRELVYAFDCKITEEDNFEYQNLFAEALLRYLKKYKIVNNSLIESGSTNFLKILQEKSKRLKLFLYTTNYSSAIDALKEVNLYGITISTQNITADEVKLAHQNNLRVAVFNTQTAAENIEAIAKNPDYIQTDKLNHLLNVLR